MKTANHFVFLIAAAFLLGACGQPPEPTLPRASYRYLSLIVPPGLTAEVQGETIPADLQPEGPVLPSPEHIQVTLFPSNDKNPRPNIYVFPASYAEMNLSIKFDMAILQGLLDGEIQPSALYSFPYFLSSGALQVIRVHYQPLNFENGRGVRYILEMANGLPPMTNEDLLYTFHGVTTDGKYLVAVTIPIRAPILVDTFDFEDPNAGLPPGGISFPVAPASNPNFVNEYHAYLASVNVALEKLSGDAFTPTLALLDALVESIQITEP